MISIRVLSAIVGSLVAMVLLSIGVVGLWSDFAARKAGLNSFMHFGPVTLRGWQTSAVFGLLFVVACIFGVLGVRALSTQHDGSFSLARASVVGISLLVGFAVGFLVFARVIFGD